MAKGSIIFCHEALRSRGGNFSLASEDLPEADVGLERSEGVAAERFVGDFVDGFGYVDEARRGFVGELGEFCEDEIPVVELGELAGEQADGFRREAVGGSAAVVDLAHGEIDLQWADIGDDAGEGDHGVEELLGIFEVAHGACSTRGWSSSRFSDG